MSSNISNNIFFLAIRYILIFMLLNQPNKNREVGTGGGDGKSSKGSMLDATKKENLRFFLICQCQLYPFHNVKIPVKKEEIWVIFFICYIYDDTSCGVFVAAVKWDNYNFSSAQLSSLQCHMIAVIWEGKATDEAWDECLRKCGW